MRIRAKKKHPDGCFFGGGDGIRTHVDLRPNGFQDRLVMTASIPLRICAGITTCFNITQKVRIVKGYLMMNMNASSMPRNAKLNAEKVSI